GALPSVGTAVWTGTVPGHTATGVTYLQFILSLPDGGITDGAVIARLHTAGSAARWDIVYNTVVSGSLGLRVYDSAGNAIQDDGSGIGFLNGDVWLISLALEQIGANLDNTLTAAAILSTAGGVSLPGTLNNRTAGRATGIRVGPNRNLGDTAIGHILIRNTAASVFDINGDPVVFGYDGESAADRITRLGVENNVPITIIGELARTPAMGPQRVATLLELLDEAAAADGGILHDSRDELGLEYRTRASLYNQARALTLDYGDKRALAPPLHPVEDDQQLRNDVTVQR
ncbi:hypothetical protein ACFQ07_19320, partial [Actinomadura adrarensis]